MTNALVTRTVSSGEVVQQTNALRYLNHWGTKSSYGLQLAFIRAYMLQGYYLPSPASAQSYVDDLAMWCGQPM